MAHGNYDEFWQARNIRPHLKNIKPAVLTVGGWFDAENLFGALETYKHVEANSPADDNHLVMGPWTTAAGRAATAKRSATSRSTPRPAEFFREKIELPFFEYHLKGEGRTRPCPRPGSSRPAPTGGGSSTPGRPRNPPANALSSQPSGKLAFEPPGANEPSAFDEYVSDPAKPVPLHRQRSTIGMSGDYMTADQRFAVAAPRRADLPDRRAGRGPDAGRADQVDL